MLPKSINDYIISNKCSTSIKRLMALLPPDLMGSIEKVLSYSRPNPPTLKLLAETALDLRIRTGKDPLDAEFHSLAESSGLKDALDRLREKRNKKLASINQEIKKQISALGLKHINLKFDPDLEESFLELSSRIYSSDELKDLVEEIEKLMKEKGLDGIFKTYNDGK